MVFSSVQMGALITAALLMIIGTVGLVYLDDVIKKIIGASFIGDGVNLLLISLGYKANGITYIFLQNMEVNSFLGQSSYPLPFALVLTSIVIGASTLAVMLALTIVLYKRHGTLSASVLLNDKRFGEDNDE
ncbi:cation:proton antiporter subunit C [Methanosphaera sp.]|jgi:energy-converting hydrogenase B subunit E|uniref:cation:proton antiporter subunit C n=1 Tax=Methanosphaera sp. TaxID=2666342 RepID=UPI003D939047